MNTLNAEDRAAAVAEYRTQAAAWRLPAWDALSAQARERWLLRYENCIRMVANARAQMILLRGCIN